MNTSTDLTRNQGLVLGVLRQAAAPRSAYDILDGLRADGFRAPLQVYRALDKLVERGLVHRLESLNAFVACAHPGEDHLPAFLICTDCRRVAETAAPAGRGMLEAAASASGFRLERILIDAEGCCAHCQEPTLS